MRHISSDKVVLLIGGLIFVSGLLSLLMGGRKLTAPVNADDGLNQVGVDLAQGSRSRLLSTRMRALDEGETTYQVELETNAKP